MTDRFRALDHVPLPDDLYSLVYTAAMGDGRHKVLMSSATSTMALKTFGTQIEAKDAATGFIRRLAIARKLCS